MTAYDRKHSVEPDDIAGADLPDWMQHRGPLQGLIHSMPAAIVLWGIIITVGIQLWMHWPAGWSL